MIDYLFYMINKIDGNSKLIQANLHIFNYLIADANHVSSTYGVRCPK